jgi:hypothetical protein
MMIDILREQVAEMRLTAEEREAMEAAASWLDASDDPEANRRADAIYGFLNRAK